MAEALRVVTTGSNRGLGLELVRRHLAGGHSVLATCREPDEAHELKAVVSQHGDRARIARCDVADERAGEQIRAALPWPQVDRLVLNAGVSAGADASAARIDFPAAERAFRVNALGALRVAGALEDRLAKGARVAAVTSRMGSIADNTSGGSYGYRMSKAALNMGIRCIALELAPRGIVAFAIHPGWVRTDMGRRAGESSRHATIRRRSGPGNADHRGRVPRGLASGASHAPSVRREAAMGGRTAPLSIEESVAAMLDTIDRSTAELAGAFVDKDGRPLPW